jgi:hypothetical protein
VLVILANSSPVDSLGFIARLENYLDDHFLIHLSGKLSLKPWLQICPGKLICCPVQHFYGRKQPVAGKSFKGVGHICISDGVIPFVGVGQVINIPDDSRNVVLSFLAKEFGEPEFLQLSHCDPWPG